MDVYDYLSELQEDVLGLLQDAGVSEEICRKIIKLIQGWERNHTNEDSDEMEEEDVQKKRLPLDEPINRIREARAMEEAE